MTDSGSSSLQRPFSQGVASEGEKPESVESNRQSPLASAPPKSSPHTGSSSGVSIAPLAESSRSYSMADRSVDQVAFRPRTRSTIAGMCIIVAAISLATMIGVTGLGIVIVSVAVCFLVGTALVIHGMLRWETAEIAYEKERAAAEHWNARFRKLHSDSNRTTMVLSHMTDGIMMLSPTTEIVLINDAARRLLALPVDGTYVGRKFAEMVRIPEIVEAVNRTRSNDLDENVSVEVVEGSVVRPIAVRIDRMQDSEPQHLLLVLRDETEPQRVEAIRREFIANVSHELKTPLSAIKGYAETVALAIDDDPDAARHFVGQIDQQCQRLEDLIADMMRLARAQSGKGTLVVQSIDLVKVIQQAMTSFLPVAAAKEIELTVVPNDGPVRVMADEEALLTITQNLVSNALSHTNPGGQVTVACRRGETGWTMSVRDNGVGIAEEFQERIFERFYRVKGSRKTQDGGTGIGLSIVKNLTRAMNGTIRVISKPGQGATFEVFLPSPN